MFFFHVISQPQSHRVRRHVGGRKLQHSPELLTWFHLLLVLLSWQNMSTKTSVISDCLAFMVRNLCNAGMYDCCRLPTLFLASLGSQVGQTDKRGLLATWAFQWRSYVTCRVKDGPAGKGDCSTGLTDRTWRVFLSAIAFLVIADLFCRTED